MTKGKTQTIPDIMVQVRLHLTNHLLKGEDAPHQYYFKIVRMQLSLALALFREKADFHLQGEDFYVYVSRTKVMMTLGMEVQSITVSLGNRSGGPIPEKELLKAGWNKTDDFE